MWCQYGNNHSGACLVFSRKEIENCVKYQVDSNYKSRFGYVYYTQKEKMPYQTYTLNGNRLVKEGLEQYSRSFVTGDLENIFFRKHLDYRDEVEYRVVIHYPSDKTLFIKVSSALQGVIWGDRTADEELKKRNDMCNQAKIGCAHIHWDCGKPHLLLCWKQEQT